MSVFSLLSKQIGSLAHERAGNCLQAQSQNTAFIIVRLCVSITLVSGAALYMAVHGAPLPVEADAFFFAILPMLAVAVLMKTGRLVIPGLICMFALAGLSMTLVLADNSAAMILLVLMPFEALWTRNRAIILWSGLATAAILAASAFVLNMPFAQYGISARAFPVVVVLYSTILALGFSRSKDTWQTTRVVPAPADHNQFALNFAQPAAQISLGDLVIGHDRSGSVVSASPEAQSLMGVAPETLMGRGFFERVHIADRPHYLKTISDAAMGRDVGRAQIRLRLARLASRAGEMSGPVFIWSEVRAKAVENKGPDAGDEDGRLAVVCLVRDINADKQREADIAEAHAQAERNNAIRERFMANISHELRTPLNAIIGFSEMLSNPALVPADPARQREYAQIIHTSGHHLLSIVNSVLDISKIQSGNFSLYPETFDIKSLIDSCFDMVRLKAAENNISFVRAFCSNDEELVADRRACKQIILNLMSNAVKFTQTGGRITVGLRRENNDLVISVSDTGIGISAADLTNLGDPFFQASASLDRSHEGTGLGLSVVRGLVGLHGGKISIESAPGEGTMVSVRLPMDGKGIDMANTQAVMIETSARLPRNASTVQTLHPAQHSTLPSDQTTDKVKKIA